MRGPSGSPWPALSAFRKSCGPEGSLRTVRMKGPPAEGRLRQGAAQPCTLPSAFTPCIISGHLLCQDHPALPPGYATGFIFSTQAQDEVPCGPNKQLSLKEEGLLCCFRREGIRAIKGCPLNQCGQVHLQRQQRPASLAVILWPQRCYWSARGIFSPCQTAARQSPPPQNKRLPGGGG